MLAGGATLARPDGSSDGADPAWVARLAANQQAAMRRVAESCFRQHIIEEKLNSEDQIIRREERNELVCYREGVPLYKQLVINGRATGQRENDGWPPARADENWRKEVRRAAERAERFRQIIAEVPKAFDFTRLGEETVDGRPTVVYRLTPKPGYQATSRPTEMLKRVTGRAWVDAGSAHMVRLVAVVEQDFDLWGGLVLKVRKGGTYELRQKPMNGVWMPYFAEERWHARIALFKHLGHHLRAERTDFHPAALSLAKK